MRQISYADVHFLTTDALADALMTYARTLALVNAADVVRIPSLGEDGAPRNAQLLIGPASQIVAMEVTGDEVELEGADAAIQELQSRHEQRLPPLRSIVESANERLGH